MKLSFEGVRSSALRELSRIEAVARTAEGYDEDEHQTWPIKCCISAYHDCLLAVMRGDVPVEDIKGFLLAYKTEEEIKALPFCGDVFSFAEQEAV